MKRKTGLKGVEVDKISTAMNTVNLVKLEKSCCPGHGRSRTVFRLLINVPERPKSDLNQEHLADDYRASSPTASVFYPIDEGHHQKQCHADNQDHRNSQETEKQEEEADSPFHEKEQSILRRAIRIILMLFIILGIIVFFMIASQYVYLEWDRILRSLGLNKCMNGFVKLRFVGMYNPPI